MNNEQNSNDESLPLCQSRRDFTITSMLAAVGVGVSRFISLKPVQAADANNRAAFGNGPYPVKGMAAYAPSGALKLMKFQRRALGPKDVAIKLHFCGVCHSDIHTVRGY